MLSLTRDFLAIKIYTTSEIRLFFNKGVKLKGKIYYLIEMYTPTIKIIIKKKDLNKKIKFRFCESTKEFIDEGASLDRNCYWSGLFCNIVSWKTQRRKIRSLSNEYRKYFDIHTTKKKMYFRKKFPFDHFIIFLLDIILESI